MKNKRQAFTLAELLIVIAIIVIFISVAYNAIGYWFATPKEISGVVENKWAGFDEDDFRIYQISVNDTTGGGVTDYRTTSDIHRNVQIGKHYRLETKGDWVTKILGRD